MAAALLACAAAYTTPHRADFALSERASVAELEVNYFSTLATGSLVAVWDANADK